MKKKMMLALLFGATLFAVVACGKKEEKKVEKREAIEKYQVDDYVKKLADYKGLEYKKQNTEPTEEEIKEEVKAFLENYPTEINDRPVKEGDNTNIDFKGMKDGVAFDGGTAKAYDLKIGSGKFIPGFEDGIIGMKKGETKDLKLKFPEDYHSENLKGAEVVFTVTVNSISAPLEDLTDELVAKNTEFKTAVEFTANVKKELYNRKQTEATRAAQTELLKKVIDASEITGIPETLKETYMKEYVGYYEEQAKKNGLEFGEYLKKAWNMSEESMKKAAEDLALNLGAQKLIVEAIAKKEGLSCTEEEYKAEFEEYYQASGMAGKVEKAEFEKSTGRDMIEEVVVAKKVFKLLLEEGKPIEE